jgi:Ni/Co efflux regulator RcnB
MHTSHDKARRSTRLAVTLTLLLSAVLAAGPVAADKPGKGGKNDHDDRRSENRDSRGNKGKDAHHFQDLHRTAVRDYYVKDTQNGRCPPGLAKKQNGCMPPGQAKKWNIGQTLPRDVIYYQVPQRLVMQIGPPPSGHRYVRVAGDILMLAIGTGMVVDAIQNLGRS